jgi:hypothetical protein
MFDNFLVYINGQDVSDKLRFYYDVVTWTMKMSPYDKWDVKIQYQTRDLDYFYYQIPYAQQIKDFELKLIINDLPVTKVNYPEGCIPPTEDILPTEDGRGSVLEWKFDNTIITAGMGIALTKPEQPGERVILTLASSPYALMMLILAICLTLLLLGKKINLLEIALLGGVYCLLFLVMASVSDFLLGFWGSLIPGALITVGLSVLLYWKQSLFIRICIFSLIGFFTLIYPILNQLADYQDSINGIIMILLIAYLFFIALYSRFRKKAE